MLDKGGAGSRQPGDEYRSAGIYFRLPALLLNSGSGELGHEAFDLLAIGVTVVSMHGSHRHRSRLELFERFVRLSQSIENCAFRVVPLRPIVRRSAGDHARRCIKAGKQVLVIGFGQGRQGQPRWAYRRCSRNDPFESLSRCFEIANLKRARSQEMVALRLRQLGWRYRRHDLHCFSLMADGGRQLGHGKQRLDRSSGTLNAAMGGCQRKRHFTIAEQHLGNVGPLLTKRGVLAQQPSGNVINRRAIAPPDRASTTVTLKRDQ